MRRRRRGRGWCVCSPAVGGHSKRAPCLGLASPSRPLSTYLPCYLAGYLTLPGLACLPGYQGYCTFIALAPALDNGLSTASNPQRSRGGRGVWAEAEPIFDLEKAKSMGVVAAAVQRGASASCCCCCCISIEGHEDAKMARPLLSELSASSPLSRVAESIFD